eukprot:RCo026389
MASFASVLKQLPRKSNKTLACPRRPNCSEVGCDYAHSLQELAPYPDSWRWSHADRASASRTVCCRDSGGFLGTLVVPAEHIYITKGLLEQGPRVVCREFLETFGCKKDAYCDLIHISPQFYGEARKSGKLTMDQSSSAGGLTRKTPSCSETTSRPRSPPGSPAMRSLSPLTELHRSYSSVGQFAGGSPTAATPSARRRLGICRFDGRLAYIVELETGKMFSCGSGRSRDEDKSLTDNCLVEFRAPVPRPSSFCVPEDDPETVFDPGNLLRREYRKLEHAKIGKVVCRRSDVRLGFLSIRCFAELTDEAADQENYYIRDYDGQEIGWVSKAEVKASNESTYREVEDTLQDSLAEERAEEKDLHVYFRIVPEGETSLSHHFHCHSRVELIGVKPHGSSTKQLLDNEVNFWNDVVGSMRNPLTPSSQHCFAQRRLLTQNLRESVFHAFDTKKGIGAEDFVHISENMLVVAIPLPAGWLPQRGSADEALEDLRSLARVPETVYFEGRGKNSLLSEEFDKLLPSGGTVKADLPNEVANEISEPVTSAGWSVQKTKKKGKEVKPAVVEKKEQKEKGAVLALLFVFDMKDVDNVQPEIAFAEIPKKNIKHHTTHHLQLALTLEAREVQQLRLVSHDDEAMVRHLGPTAQLLLHNVKVLEQQWLFPAAGAELEDPVQPIIAEEERLERTKAGGPLVLKHAPVVTNASAVLARLRRLVEFKVGQVLEGAKESFLAQECLPPEQPRLNGLFQELKPLILELCPGLTRLGPDELQELFAAVHRTQARNGRLKSTTPENAEKAERAEALSTVFLSRLSCLQRLVPWFPEGYQRVLQWRAGLFNLPSIMAPHRTLASLINQVLLVYHLASEGKTRSGVQTSTAWQQVESHLRPWARACRKFVDSMKMEEALFRLNNGSQIAREAQSAVRQTQVNMASMQAPHEVDLFVVGLTIHKFVLKARARGLEVTPEMMAPHCVRGKMTFDCDPKSPDVENPAVRSVTFQLATGHTLTLRKYQKVRCLVRSIHNNGALESRVVAFRTCGCEHTVHTQNCWTQIHSEATTSCWMPERYFEIKRDKAVYSQIQDWFQCAYPAECSRLLAQSVACGSADEEEELTKPNPASDKSTAELSIRCGFARMGVLELLQGWKMGRFTKSSTSVYPKQNCPAYVAGLLFNECEGGPLQTWFCLAVPGKDAHEPWDIIDLGGIPESKARPRMTVQCSLYPVPWQSFRVFRFAREFGNCFRLFGERTLSSGTEEDSKRWRDHAALQSKAFRIVLGHILNPERGHDMQSQPAVPDMASLAKTLRIGVSELRQRFPAVAQMDDHQLHAVMLVLRNPGLPVTLLGSSGVGKTMVLTSMLKLRPLVCGGPLVQLYITDSNAPLDAFARECPWEIFRLVSRTHKQELDKESEVPFAYSDRLPKNVAGLSTIAVTADTFLRCWWPKDLHIATVVVDEAQGVSDMAMLSILQRCQEFQYRTVPLSFVCAGDPMQPGVQTSSGRRERSLKKNHVRRVLHLLRDPLEGTALPNPFTRVVHLTHTYRQKHPGSCKLNSEMKWGTYDSTVQDYDRTFPPVMAIRCTTTATRPWLSLMREARCKPGTSVNQRMCQTALSLLPVLAEHADTQGKPARQYSVLILSFYDGDVCYLRKELFNPKSSYSGLFKSTQVMSVNTVRSLEADIVILLATHTALEEGGRPSHWRFFRPDGVKVACTRHRKMLVLLGDPRWFSASHHNGFKKVWKRMRELQKEYPPSLAGIVPAMAGARRAAPFLRPTPLIRKWTEPDMTEE